MTEVFVFLVSCYRSLLSMLESAGGIIGMAVLSVPVLSWIARSIRSIIAKK